MFYYFYYFFLQTPTIIKEYGAITDINFCPTSPYDFAVTNSTRVRLCTDKDYNYIVINKESELDENMNEICMKNAMETKM